MASTPPLVPQTLQELYHTMTENPQLSQLFFDLVNSNVITAEEFWTDYAPQWIKKQ